MQKKFVVPPDTLRAFREIQSKMAIPPEAFRLIADAQRLGVDSARALDPSVSSGDDPVDGRGPSDVESDSPVPPPKPEASTDEQVGSPDEDDSPAPSGE